MESHRGMGSVLGIFFIFGALLLLTYAVFEYKAQYSPQSAVDDVGDPGRQVRESLITSQRNDEMAEYSLGIYYTLNNFFGYSLHLKEVGGSMESWCDNGKVSRKDPELLYTVNEILRYREDVPYIFRPEADGCCFASGTDFVVSANVYDENGLLVPLCMDATGEYGNIANPKTLRCDPGGYVLFK